MLANARSSSGLTPVIIITCFAVFIKIGKTISSSNSALGKKHQEKPAKVFKMFFVMKLRFRQCRFVTRVVKSPPFGFNITWACVNQK